MVKGKKSISFAVNFFESTVNFYFLIHHSLLKSTCAARFTLVMVNGQFLRVNIELLLIHNLHYANCKFFESMAI